MAIEEKYNLTPSGNFKLTGRQEQDQDLNLDTSTTGGGAPVTGTVTTPTGTPVPGVTIKIFDSKGKPYEHATANAQGEYAFTDIPNGSYFITGSVDGHFTPNRIPFSVILNQPVTVPALVMVPDTRTTTSAVYGIVGEPGTDVRITGATVELFELQAGTPVSRGVVKTNEDGQYLFADLPAGQYYVVSSKNGYVVSQSAPITIAANQYAPININLTEDPETNTGTISGIIKDKKTGLPIPSALVALYSVKEDGSETIIKFTRTTAEGLYLFGELPSDNYKVKATLQNATP